MTLEKTDFPGTGNSRCNVPKDIMIKYNNMEINMRQVSDFFIFLYNEKGYEKVKDISVLLSNRKTVKRWGTANISKNKLLLYRHSIWIFLHELSHLISSPKKINGRRDIHGVDFGRTLTDLFNHWKEFMGNEVTG